MKNSSALNSPKCPWLLVSNCSTTADSGSGKQGITKRVKQHSITTNPFLSAHQNEKSTSAMTRYLSTFPTKNLMTTTSNFKKVCSYWERKNSVQSIRFLNASIDFIKIFSIFLWGLTFYKKLIFAQKRKKPSLLAQFILSLNSQRPTICGTLQAWKQGSKIHCTTHTGQALL